MSGVAASVAGVHQLLEVVSDVVPPGAEAASWTDVASAVAAIVAAVAALLTLGVAVVAARYAKRQVDGARAQLDEARTLRREQAQPYVVVYAEPSPVDPHFVNIVIRNFGATGAHDVAVTSTPPLTRTNSGGMPEAVALPAAMPFLAPGQQWRTFWDSSPDRLSSDLPDRHDLHITFNDSNGQPHTTAAVLDWVVFRQRMWMGEKTVHHAAKSLASIDKTLAALSRRSGPGR